MENVGGVIRYAEEQDRLRIELAEQQHLVGRLHLLTALSFILHLIVFTTIVAHLAWGAR